LTLQLFVFIVLPLALLLVALTFGSLTLHQGAMRALVAERDKRAVQAASAAIAEQLHHRAAAIQGVVAYAAVAAPDQTLEEYAFLLPDFEGGLALFSADGKLLAASPAASSEIWHARPVAELLQSVSRQSEAEFSAPFRNAANGDALIMVAAASPNGLSAVGTFLPSNLARRALGDAIASSDQTNVIVAAQDGQMLYQLGQWLDVPAILEHPGVAEALRGQVGTTYMSAAGREHVVAFGPVPPVGWALIIEEPWESVDNPLLRTTQAAPLVLVPLLVAALVAVGFGIRQIVQPLRALEQQASELAWGRYDAIETPVGGIAEIQNLQAQLVIMARKVKTAQQSLRGYVGAITTGQEDERQRLARELHDETVQSLVALDQRVQLAIKGSSPEATERLAELRRMIAALLEDVRRVIRALRPIYLEDLGLLPAIEMLTRDLQATTGAQAAFAVSGPARRLPPGHEIAVYRIVQEALTNAARYASAQTVSVSVEFSPPEVTVRVADNGKGFAAPERVSDLVASGHYGLMGMQERAELIGASLTIHATPGAGSIIELRLPL
jgi:signal transduction histidine kinase